MMAQKISATKKKSFFKNAFHRGYFENEGGL